MLGRAPSRAQVPIVTTGRHTRGNTMQQFRVAVEHSDMVNAVFYEQGSAGRGEACLAPTVIETLMVGTGASWQSRLHWQAPLPLRRILMSLPHPRTPNHHPRSCSRT